MQALHDNPAAREEGQVAPGEVPKAQKGPACQKAVPAL